MSDIVKYCHIFVGSGFLNERIYRLSLSFMILDEKSSGFGPSVGQKQRSEDVTLGTENI